MSNRSHSETAGARPRPGELDLDLGRALPAISALLALLFLANGIALALTIEPDPTGPARYHHHLPAILMLGGVVQLVVLALLLLRLREVAARVLVFGIQTTVLGIGVVAAPGPTETVVALELGTTVLLSVIFERPGLVRLVGATASVAWCIVFAARLAQGLISTDDQAAVVQFAVTPPVVILFFTAFVTLALRAVRNALVERDEANAALRVANAQALAASRAKSTFLASMSHELRTPLNAIIGYSELVLEEPDDVEGVEHGVGQVSRAGHHLLDLVNGVLDMSAIEAGRLELAPEDIALDELISGVVATVRPLVDRRGNTLEVALSPEAGWIRADPTRLRQIVINLISNAAKFTEHGHIRLSTSRRDDGVAIVIEDTGTGIAPDKLADVFEPFVRDATSALRVPGTGLGLSIVRELVQLMQGWVIAESELGVGTRFTVWLPAARRERASA